MDYAAPDHGFFLLLFFLLPRLDTFPSLAGRLGDMALRSDVWIFLALGIVRFFVATFFILFELLLLLLQLFVQMFLIDFLDRVSPYLLHLFAR